jgi:Tol biopolymer transport system component
MGEVYKARDLRLSRVVALKLVPVAVTLDPERRERLQREAQFVAGLNHPNIVTLFSVETSDGGALFLTMELVEGRSLADAIPRAGMPIEHLLRIAIPLVDAVAAAHQKGITHRDLKPANIMLGDGEHSGRVKVLDFGLAKLTAIAPGSDGASVLPTKLETAEGRILGTVAYMSPEQAQGEPIDTRSDLFSLGIILYEMATGRRPFAGATSISIISSIVKDTPVSVSELNASLPRELGRIIRRALVKDPEHRYQTAKDLRNDLEDLKASLDSGDLAAAEAFDGAAVRRSRTRPWQLATLGIAAISVAAVLAVLWRGSRPATEPSTPSRIQMVRVTSTGNARSPGLSPDGKYVAYVEDDQSVWVHQIAGSSHARIVEAAPDVSILALAVTPDGGFVDFVRQEGNQPPALWRVPFLGGAPRKLVDQAWSAPSWSPDGKQMALMTSSFSVTVADADGARPHVIAARKAPQRYLSLEYLIRQDFRPAWLPDGQSLVVVGNDDSRGYTALQLVTINIATRAETILTLPESRDLRAGMGMALARDGRSFILSQVIEGGPSQIVRVRPPSGELSRLTNDVNEYAGVSVAGDAVATAERQVQSSVWVADASGSGVRQVGRDVPAELAPRGSLAWAGSGRVIYFASLAGGSGLWSLDLSTKVPQLIVPEGKTPATSADGQTLIFMRGVGTLQLWRADLDGRNAVEIPGAVGFTPSIMPDGSAIFYGSLVSGSQAVWKADLRGTGAPHQFNPAFVGAYGIQVSPDGRYVVLASHRGVKLIVPTSGDGAVRSLTIERGDQIRWAPDGRALAYVKPDAPSNIWLQPLDGSAPSQLTTFVDRRIAAYAWSPDGKQLAMSRAIDASDIVLLKGVE